MSLHSPPLRKLLPEARVSLLTMIGMLTVVAGGPAGAVDLMGSGVVCDRPRQICYDSRGPSLLETRRQYGRSAEQRLLRQLSGRPPMETIPFSSGELCDLRARQCWDDGWKRTNISHRLTRHLFGFTDSGSDTGTVERRCELRQRGRRLFQGPCRFSRSQGQGERRFMVELEDGRRYRFIPRDGRLWLSDASGDWPTRVNRTTRTLTFQWADLQLNVDRPVARAEDTRGSTEQLMMDLIDSLFR